MNNSIAVTDIGKLRRTNQDFVYASDSALGGLDNFYMVADGMGGHRGGGFASRYAVERMTELLASDRENEAVPAMNRALATVNQELFQKAAAFDELRGMGTTIVAATTSGGTMYVMNIGDSRLYLVSDSIRQVTRDHSLVEDMIAQGKLTRGSTLYYQKKNVITRAVGVAPAVTADFFEVDVHSGDKVLLCTDGLSNLVSDSEILDTLSRAGTGQEAAARLLQMANAGGGPDNISAVIIDMDVKSNEEAIC